MLLIEFVLDNNLNISGICEAWLSEDDNAVLWVNLHPNGYTQAILRLTRHGRGVGI